VNQSPNPKVDFSKTKDQGSTPPLKECNQEWGEENNTLVAQQDIQVNQEMCLITNPKSARKLSLVVDCACTNTMVGDQNVLQNLTQHEAGIKGVHKDLLPLLSSQRGVIKGYVLSQSGMHIPFPEVLSLPVIHSNDTVEDLLSLNQIVESGWCSMQFTREETGMTHVYTGEKLSFQEEGKLNIIDVYLEDDEQNSYKSTVDCSPTPPLTHTNARTRARVHIHTHTHTH
jgi:hypothetical protein